MDKKENMAFLVAQDDLVCLGGKVTKEMLWVYRDLRVLRARLDFQEE